MWNLKNDAIELTYKTEADSATEDRIVLAKGKGVGGGWSRSLGLEMQTAVYTTDRQQFLLPSAGSCTQGPVINRNEENTRKNVCVCVVVVVQFPGRVRLFATPWTAACQASLSFTISRCLLKRMSIESVMPSNHLILCRPLLLLPSIFPSIKVFSNELTFWIRWPNYWRFSFSISPSNKYSGLISFRIDAFDLLAVQGTLKSLLPIIFIYIYIYICTHTYMCVCV